MKICLVVRDAKNMYARPHELDAFRIQLSRPTKQNVIFVKKLSKPHKYAVYT